METGPQPMKVLFVGGTGFISAAASRMAIAQGFEVHLLNRATRLAAMPGAQMVVADINRPEEARAALQGQHFDAVVDWVAFTADDIERHLDLVRGRTKQYVFISSASAYQKPPEHYLISETTPLINPYWDYARGKIACEERLLLAYRDEGLPVTIVRPSMTYDANLPVALGWGSYTVADRMLKGLPIVVHGDGTSLWVVTHADDLARGLLGLLGNERALGEAFQITTDEVLTWDRVYRGIAEALGVQANLVHVPSEVIARVVPEQAGSLFGDKMWSVAFDNRKIKEFVPGYQATVSFHDGIRRTLDWFAAEPARRVMVDQAANAEMERVLAVATLQRDR
jgi:nucleoside-diphosphate-sugar epimerase